MNKKFFGIKIGTLLQFFLCLVLASIIWFVVQYANTPDEQTQDNEETVSVTDDFSLR